MDTLHPIPYIDQISTNGAFKVLLNAIVGVAVWQIVAKREELARLWIRLLEEAISILQQLYQTHRKQHIDKISERVSSVYTQMYLLLYMQPTRVSVIRYEYEKAEDGHHVLAYMIHEAVYGLPSIKGNWQGVDISSQMINLLVAQTERELEVYIPDVDAMEDGPLKDIMTSYNTRSFFNAHLAKKPTGHYSLLVAFNRVDAVEPTDRAQIRLCAANIKKLMFMPV